MCPRPRPRPRRVWRALLGVALAAAALLCLTARPQRYWEWDLFDTRRLIHMQIEDSISQLQREEAVEAAEAAAAGAAGAGAGCSIPRLDPFAPHMMRGIKPLPPITCYGDDWVTCYLHECWIKPSALASHRGVRCAARDVLRVDDYRGRSGGAAALRPGRALRLRRSDYVRVNCTGVSRSSGAVEEWRGYGLGLRPVARRGVRAGAGAGGWSVLLLVFDSTSRSAFIRLMPRSYKVLMELGFVVLQGYNILGDGTLQALFPLLSGRTELEFSKRFMKPRLPGSGDLVDHRAMLFYQLEQEGYRTAYLEDSPAFGTFNYRLSGFGPAPAQHYLRSLWNEQRPRAGWSTSGGEHCHGDTPVFQMLFNITEQFMRLSGPKFGLSFSSELSHDDVAGLAHADGALARLLRGFHREGALRDTALVVMGDHGSRYNGARDTLQGKLEERLPLMAWRLPDGLRALRPGALENLKTNAHRLTTPRDIHETILHVAGASRWRRRDGANSSRAMSLLEPIPLSRTCGAAGVTPHWCACLRWSPLAAAAPAAAAAAAALVRYINGLTEPYRSRCAARRLRAVSWALRARARREVLRYAGPASDDNPLPRLTDHTADDLTNVQIRIIVDPGGAEYEATLLHMETDDRFIVTRGDISRTNMYRNESKCISSLDPSLDPYCYCENDL